MSFIRKRDCLRAICIVGAWCGVSASALATPLINQVGLLNAPEVKQDAVLEIVGSGFGVKETAAPVLFDHVSHAYEYGRLNERHSSLTNMAAFPVGRAGDPNAIWATRTSTAFYSTERPKRHPNSRASYFLKGESAWFGGPVAYGGADGWDTPTDNSQLYVSWWYKNKYHSTGYWRFSPQAQSGEFVSGEALSTNNGGTGVYVGIDSDGLHNAVLVNAKSSLKNAIITGEESGATTVFPDHSRGGSGTGYESPGSKLARVWDDPSGHGAQGIRSSVALHDFYVSTPSGYANAKIYDKLKVPAGEWVHLEYELDTDVGVVRMYEDGRFRGEGYFDPEAVYRGKYSPTLSLIGTNAKQLKLQESEISEIYVDSSLQRVVIGNAPRYEDVTHHELQRPISWINNKIEVHLNLGALDLKNGLYVYVFDRDSNVNQEGVPLCANVTCISPPSFPLMLRVE